MEVKGNMTKYVGLDVHLRTCHATVTDERGRVLKQEKFPNERQEIERIFKSIGDAKVAMEACYCWQPVYEQLEAMGHKVELAHPMKTRIIAEARIKTDALDSEALAHLLRADLLPTSYVPPREFRELRELVRLRTYLVRERTRFKNKIRAELAKRGIRVLKNPFAKRRAPTLGGLGIETVNHCLSMIGALDERIKQLSKELEAKANKSEEATLLMTIPGVGYFTAVAILAEIGDISRFGDPEKLCSYAGLVPSVHQSGATRYYGRITKQGSKMLRWVIQECLWVHLRFDTHISRFFFRLARHKGKKIAAVAAARKLLVVMYWMLVRKEKFRA
jgi:transposase